MPTPHVGTVFAVTTAILGALLRHLGYQTGVTVL